jgi:anti-anti-sigma factor
MRDEPLVMTATPGQHPDTTVLTLSGPLTLHNMFAFQQDIRQYTPAVLIMDLSGSPYMDSAGLGALMNFYVSAQKNGRKVLLTGVNDRIRALLETTRVDSLLKSYPSVAEAEASVRT